MTAQGTLPFAHSDEHVAAELAWLNLRLETLLATDRAAAAEPFRGLFVSDAETGRLLRSPGGFPSTSQPSAPIDASRQSIDARVAASNDAGVVLALPRIVDRVHLSGVEASLLLLAMAPDLEPAYERIFANYHDDIARRRATVGLALKLFGNAAEDRHAVLTALAPDGRLSALGLLRTTGAGDAPLLSHAIAVADDIAAFVLRAGQGDIVAKPARGGFAWLRWPDTAWQPVADRLRPGGAVVCQLVGPPGTGRGAFCDALCGEAGLSVVSLDAARHVGDDAFEAALALTCRTATLHDAAVFVAGNDDTGGNPQLDAIHRASLLFNRPIFVALSRAAATPGEATLRIDLPLPSLSQREAIWAQLGGHIAGLDSADLALRFRLTPGAIGSIVKAAEAAAAVRGTAPTAGDILAACYDMSTAKLRGLARRLPWARGWADLTVSPGVAEQLTELGQQVRHRRRVYEEWGFAANNPGARGLCVLFLGPSGTGKTMATEVLGTELKLQVYKIDLSQIVSKYIGETEKNLSAIFEAAEASNAVLFFDEADSLFGKRSEVKDAHDRYANIEVNYLLQRIDEFDGLAILASNLRGNIDDGFFRRMHMVIEFRPPEMEHRYRIWQQHVPSGAGLAPDVDFAFLAERFKLSGGNIRNIVLNAAFLAAGQGSDIRMEHFVRATRRECDKLGQLSTAAEFGRYATHLRGL